MQHTFPLLRTEDECFFQTANKVVSSVWLGWVGLGWVGSASCTSIIMRSATEPSVSKIYYDILRRSGKEPSENVSNMISLGARFLLDAVYVVCFLPIHSGHQVRWTYQPGSHRRKVTQDF